MNKLYITFIIIAIGIFTKSIYTSDLIKNAPKTPLESKNLNFLSNKHFLKYHQNKNQNKLEKLEESYLKNIEQQATFKNSNQILKSLFKEQLSIEKKIKNLKFLAVSNKFFKYISGHKPKIIHQ